MVEDMKYWKESRKIQSIHIKYIWRGPAQDVTYDLILWYVLKIIYLP